jgi:hypothetical protein
MSDVAAALPGDIIKDAQAGIEYRVLFVEAAGMYVYEVRNPVPRRHARGKRPPREGRNALPPPLPEYWEWERCEDEEQLEVYAPTSHVRAESTLTPKELEYQRSVARTIELIGNQEPGIYDAAERARLIKAAADELKVRPQRVLAHLRSYWAAGKDVTAIYGYWSRRGGPGKLRADGGTKFGRRRAPGRIRREGVGVNRASVVPDPSRKENQAVPEREYVKRAWLLQKTRKWSDSKAYDHYRRLAHPVDVLDAEGRRRRQFGLCPRKWCRSLSL